MTRKLSLTTEHLTELTTDDLATVAGGAVAPPTDYCTGNYPTVPLAACVTKMVQLPKVPKPLPTTDCFTGTTTTS